MSLALTDRPATRTGIVKPRMRPLVVDPVLDAPPRLADRPSVQPGPGRACQLERVRARIRRRRWAIRAACAVPVLASAVLAAPAQPRQIPAPTSPDAVAAKAPPSTTSTHDVRASSPLPGECSPLWALAPARSPWCLLSPAPAGRPVP